MPDFSLFVELPHPTKNHDNLKMLVITDGAEYNMAKKLGIGTVYPVSEISNVVILLADIPHASYLS